MTYNVMRQILKRILVLITSYFSIDSVHKKKKKKYRKFNIY